MPSPARPPPPAAGRCHDGARQAGAQPGTGPGAPPESYTKRLAAITGQYLTNFLAFDEQLETHHPAGTFHEHLAILAVRPDRQGQGIGTALLHARHTVLEDQGIPAYLEASDERTRRIYLDHGYADRGSPIGFADGVRMHPMWREQIGRAHV